MKLISYTNILHVKQVTSSAIRNYFPLNLRSICHNIK